MKKCEWYKCKRKAKEVYYDGLNKEMNFCRVHFQKFIDKTQKQIENSSGEWKKIATINKDQIKLLVEDHNKKLSEKYD